MVWPAMLTMIVLNTINIWNELLFALLFIADEDKRTLPVGLVRFYGYHSTDYALVFAALTITTVPILVALFPPAAARDRRADGDGDGLRRADVPSGVIEGFYGRAWTRGAALEMIDWIARRGNEPLRLCARRTTSSCAPAGANPMTRPKLAALARAGDSGRARGLTIMVAIAPCLDVTYSDAGRSGLR